MNELIDAKGKLLPTEGNFCIFTLTDGRILYSETAVIGDKFIDFDASKTMGIQFGPSERPGEVRMGTYKLTMPSSFFPVPMSKIRVSREAVILMQDTTSKELVTSMRSQMSGIALVK